MSNLKSQNQIPSRHTIESLAGSNRVSLACSSPWNVYRWALSKKLINKEEFDLVKKSYGEMWHYVGD
jgi:hypothetical protein